MGLLTPRALSPAESNELIERNLNFFLRVSEPKAIVLFGSAARGQMTEASDLDFALIYQDTDSLEQGRTEIYAAMGPDNVFWPRDIVFFTADELLLKAEKGGLCQLILQEGRVLHGDLS